MGPAGGRSTQRSFCSRRSAKRATIVILIPLSFAGLVSGLLCIRADYRQSQRQFFIFKPLTTALIILLALLAPLPANADYKWLILAGLLFSLAGDIFLMLPRDRFIAGLISFLIAQEK